LEEEEMASYPRIILSAMLAGMIFAYVDMPILQHWEAMGLKDQLTLLSFNLVVLGFVISFATEDPFHGLPAAFIGIIISIVLYMS
jgi:hypothetical protein